jgi:serine phosphatase RsbU (regulator of sigma subunit)
LVYSSAGHCPGYILDAKGEIRTILPSLGMPLGIDRTKTYPASSCVALQADDLHRGSDGV